MRSYLFRNPIWIHWFYPTAIWQIKSPHKVIYLTFDDGPDPEVTPWVLNELNQYDAKATFFCIGEKVVAYGATVHQIMDEGHAVGNHTYTHKNGWKSSVPDYWEDVELAGKEIAKYNDTRLFRPPYGNLRPGQLRHLKSQGMEVIIWSHLSGDFDQRLDIAKSLQKLKAAGPGSILLFHDTQQSFKNLRQILPIVLDHFSTLGYQFKTL